MLKQASRRKPSRAAAKMQVIRPPFQLPSLALAMPLILWLSLPLGAVADETHPNLQSGTTETAPQTSSEAAPKVASEHQSLIKWEGWSDDLFQRAKQQNKLVILDLEAIWCHWCHVMDARTYSQPEVAKILNTNYICVKVDQDSRPDLSNKYEQYGWPATVIFRPSGEEVDIRSGFIPPDDMVAMLNDCVKHPQRSPEDKPAAAHLSFTKTAALSKAIRHELEQNHVNGYDTTNGGWGTEQKFLDWDTVEYAMWRAAAGDKDSEKRAQEALRLEGKLIDPVWGGVYQYSTDHDWDHPHFEKIMQMQAEELRIYALAYALFHHQADLQCAQNIEKFLRQFLMSPDGAFYTSMDADLVPGQHSGDYFALNDSQRREKGLPRIDKHIYARENGWAINGLTNLYMASSQPNYLKEAQRATDWIIANRALPDGGFKHDSDDKSGPYLGDTLAMGRAFLSLYTATGDRQWLNRAQAAATFMNIHFSETANGGKSIGYATADLTKKSIPAWTPQLDENVQAARFFNLLYRYSGDQKYQKMAQEAMRYLAAPEIARSRHTLVGGILLADTELAGDPAHITVVGKKDDPDAALLFSEAIKYPSGYKRIEWWDMREGSMPNPDVEYPQMPKAAAFICVDGRCSSPVYKPEAIAGMIEQSQKKQ